MVPEVTVMYETPVIPPRKLRLRMGEVSVETVKEEAKRFVPDDGEILRVEVNDER